jgi:hypothetical protein
MGKFWVPPGGASGKLPLVVYLHGIVIPEVGLWGAGRMIADDATLKQDAWSMNPGNLAAKLMADGKITPIVVAAPSEDPKLYTGNQLWLSMDFGEFVDNVFQRARDQYSVNIDLDRVAVVGWSGAGCYAKAGLDKVAQAGGKFNAGGGSHTVALIGHADTLVAYSYSNSVHTGLKKAGNTTTAVYSLHKGSGGGDGGDAGDGGKHYASGFEAKNDLTGKPLPSPMEDADRDAFQLYIDDGQNPPMRTVAKVWETAKGIDRHWSKDICGANASSDKPARASHGKMVLVWSWYALPRYFPK